MPWLKRAYDVYLLMQAEGTTPHAVSDFVEHVEPIVLSTLRPFLRLSGVRDGTDDDMMQAARLRIVEKLPKILSTQLESKEQLFKYLELLCRNAMKNEFGRFEWWCPILPEYIKPPTELSREEVAAFNRELVTFVLAGFPQRERDLARYVLRQRILGRTVSRFLVLRLRCSPQCKAHCRALKAVQGGQCASLLVEATVDLRIRRYLADLYRHVWEKTRDTGTGRENVTESATPESEPR